MVPDDQGWTDAAVFGSEYYDTPNIDRLAARGIRFTNAYAANPLCSPTRLSILTGMYPHRYGMTAPHGHYETIPLDTPRYRPDQVGASWKGYLEPVSARSLPNDAPTYGKVFKAAGYATAFMGKWHLGKPPYTPENHGFDVVVGGRGNPGPPGGYFSPWTEDTLPERPEGTHIDDTITDEALNFIEASARRNQPFLLNLWFYDVHGPFEGKARLTAKYRQRTDGRGMQDLPVMGAMIETMDDNVGRVLDKLDQLGIADNTIIVYWSDNGGNMYDVVDGTYPTNNAPLRSGKGNIHEGGIRVPAMVVWPGISQPGAVSAALVSSIDIYPTLMEMTGLNAPEGVEFDGTNLAPLIRGEPFDRDTTFFHFPHYVTAPSNISASAVRHGDYKLIRRYAPDGDKPFTFELYNLRDDVGESVNLAALRADIVQELDAMIARHLEDTGTPVPPRNPAFDPDAFNPITSEGNETGSLMPSPTAGDWYAAGGNQVHPDDGSLIVTSVNTDPWIRTESVPPFVGSFIARLRMKINTQGDGQVFWRSQTHPAFDGQGVWFNVNHDGQWHEYTVEVNAEGPLIGFRIDPGRDRGEIEIDWIEILSPAGESLRRWDF